MIKIIKATENICTPNEVAGKFFLSQYRVKWNRQDDTATILKIVKVSENSYGLITVDTHWLTGFNFKAVCIEELLNLLLDEPDFEVYIDED